MIGKTNSLIPAKHLSNKTVVITGASSGAGRAAAIEFARHGATIVLAGRNILALEEVEAICRAMGAAALAVRADVTDAGQMKQLAVIAAEFGNGIDVWVNNAGVLAAGVFDETPIEVHGRVIQTNLVGYIYGSHAVLPYFKEQQHGILINNISVGGWFPVPFMAAYSAAKFGLRAFSAALRGELSKYPGIYICDIYPAFLDTPGIQHAANYTGKSLKPVPPVYDPQRVARTIVKIVHRPVSSVTIGSVSTFLKFAFACFPGLSMKITAFVLRSYLKKANPSEHTTGNLFEPARFGTSIHGGWSATPLSETTKKVALKSLVAAGFAVGFFACRKIC